MSPPHVVRRLLVAMALLVVLGLGAAAPATASVTAAHVAPVAISASTPADVGPAGAPANPPDDADDHDHFGWGPSRVIWAGFGWLGVVLVAAILVRRRVSRRH